MTSMENESQEAQVKEEYNDDDDDDDDEEKEEEKEEQRETYEQDEEDEVEDEEEYEEEVEEAYADENEEVEEEEEGEEEEYYDDEEEEDDEDDEEYKDDNNDNNNNNNDNQCGVYLAPSTIPGAGNGIFAGRFAAAGDASLLPPDLVVPVTDYVFHNHFHPVQDMYRWFQHSWDGDTFQGVAQEAWNAHAQIMGAGPPMNCHFALNNFEYAHDHDLTSPYDTMTMTDHSWSVRRHPGTGAFTQYHHIQGSTIADIPAGAELFVNYGEGYFNSEKFATVPLSDHYDRASQLLQDFANFRDLLLYGDVDNDNDEYYDDDEEEEEGEDYEEDYVDHEQNVEDEEYYKGEEGEYPYYYEEGEEVLYEDSYEAEEEDFAEDDDEEILQDPLDEIEYYDLVVEEDDEYDEDEEEYSLDERLQILFQNIYDVSTAMTRIWDPALPHALPHTVDQVDGTLDYGWAFAHQDRTIRSLEWLQEHGSCADHLDSGPSTIPYAGLGAFVKRPIAQGETIVPAPLIHFEHKSRLDMYRPRVGRDSDAYYHWTGVGDENDTDDNNDNENDDDQDDDDDSMEYTDPRATEEGPYHRQLYLNYCFGHDDTDLLLCPDMSSGLINHSKEKANAKMVWSTKHMTHPEWLTMSPEEWVHTDDIGLAWDFVATRDLEPGEQVLIDYGNAWEQAWQQHVTQWTSMSPPDQEPCLPLSAMTLNDHGRDLVFPTVFERFHHISSLNAHTHHHDDNNNNNNDNRGGNWTVCDASHIPPRHLPELSCHGLLLDLWGLQEYFNYDDDHYPCRIVDRYTTTTTSTTTTHNNVAANGPVRYTIELFYRLDLEFEPETLGTQQCVELFEAALWGVPSDFFQFQDRPYAHEFFQPGSFRHAMQIPNDLLPAAWRRSSTTTSTAHNTTAPTTTAAATTTTTTTTTTRSLETPTIRATPSSDAETTTTRWLETPTRVTPEPATTTSATKTTTTATTTTTTTLHPNPSCTTTTTTPTTTITLDQPLSEHCAWDE
ncbi:hypothetical protein ACA910_002359 [Epithemia clementina (nom. ined.)]